ncbi:Rv3235 family protein [Rhodococcus sp. CH91]|uniref:Rv3235 family protein n=1 Tax=Rhodococcus sp. CH91 TaxID=2910256 RepID=UPI001F4AC689|nr:Rv3235 family protein [Rhodococcus sp. CH91]
MSHTTGRYVRRLTHLEPPVEESCGHPRSHAAPRATPHDGRSGRPAPAAGNDHTAARAAEHRSRAEDTPEIVLDPAAARFAGSALRLVLESVDGRRPAAQLATVLDPRLVSTLTAGRAPRAGRGTAVLLRTRVRAVDPDTAEIFGSYSRGDRVFAFAGRMVRTRPRARMPHRWTITTLWLG